MPDRTDPAYLRGEQYRDASKLNARINIYRFSTNPVAWHRWVFEQFRLPAAGRILELGCGPATLWAENLERIPRGWDITLADFSPGMLEAARRALGPYESYFRYQEMDAQAIPFADRTLDGVIANHMLYHVPDRPRALREIARVLKPGGLLYAATNGQGHLTKIGELIGQVDPAALDAWHAGVDSDADFTLENGAGQLAPYFASVAKRRYRSELRVTE
ncbi:MAG TPA: class I SAM-dependent methyltransferase, partial [Ktedonobacterales bacterium]